jgi:ABC-type uncharacterized transport system substrate-binding protein
MSRLRRASILAVLALTSVSQAVLAHPHVRISAEVSVVVEKGAIVALKHRWTFDEEFRRSNFDEFDVDQNGILEESELSAFRELSLDTLKRFDSFTVVSSGGAKIKLKEPAAVRFDMQATKPVYEFEVALRVPVPSMEAKTTVEVYDPTYFSAFQFPSDHAITIEAKDGTICSASLASPQRASAQMKDYRAFMAAFGAAAAKQVTPQSITLNCRPAADGTSG